jgi:hypothetical protein
MRPIKKGMAFHEDNVFTKFWIYSRDGQRYVVYPWRFPNTHLAGLKIPVESFEEAIDEVELGLHLAEEMAASE